MAFVFYDTETTGTNTSFDQIIQFAAIRTDDNLNEMERFEIRCQLLPHVVPAPGALLVTGVTPRLLSDRTLPTHYQAVCQIASKLESWSPATFVGYNSINFDEPLLRQAFYQNLKPIYLTNTGGNRRADIIKLIDAAIVFAPSTLVVPLSDKGRKTRRLDTLAPANGFNHQKAHDAMADVEATIYMAKLVRNRSPNLWNAMIATSTKDSAVDLLRGCEALALVEANYGRHSVFPITWCGYNPSYKTEVCVFDLRFDPAEFLPFSADELTRIIRAGKGPIRIVKANSNPTLLPLSQVSSGTIPDLPSHTETSSRARSIKENEAFQINVGQAVSDRYPAWPSSEHVEEQIFNGFPSAADTRLASAFHETSWSERKSLLNQMSDDRLRKLGLRLIAIEANSELSSKEQSQFEQWLQSRRKGPTSANKFRTIEQAVEELKKELTNASSATKSRLLSILSWLEAE